MENVTTAEFREFKERMLESHTDIKARLSSIDASISAITPLLTAHSERFNTMDEKCINFDKKTTIVAKRVDRIEKGVLGVTSLAILGMFAFFSNNILAHIFPPKGA